ncbi:glucose-1-phosphate thymidylyltransferase [Streptomyces sp. NPDC001599]|uniref:glucose-1-phosphate thymidylyltransferase n=1 Tax=Streptomyces sp. NPDC001599 TaxID=3364591 RepID=UPI0036BC8376
MKALVLSGGMGTRLRPLTHSMAKQLVPVANKPVLVHCLENIRDIGVTEVGVVVGDHAEEIAGEIGDGSDLGLRITYLRQEAPLGLGHCVVIAREFLGDEDFVMYLGDNVLAEGITEAADAFATRRPAAQVVVTKVLDPRQYGVAEVGEDQVVRALVEKPRRPRSDLAVIGVYFFTARIHDAVRAVPPSARGELEITDAIQHLVDQGRTVTAVEHSGYWQDTGRADGLLECNRVLLDRVETAVRGQVDQDSVLDGPVVVEHGATVVRSRLTGPLVVGSGAVVQDSRIGPHTSLGANCTVNGSDVEDSILLRGAVLDGVGPVRGSLLGRDSQVTSPPGTRAHQFVVGDDCRAVVA